MERVVRDWMTEDVYGYMQAKRIPAPTRVQVTETTSINLSSGFTLTASSLRYMRDHYPEDYRRVLDVFPYAEAMIVHETFHGHKRAPKVARGKGKNPFDNIEHLKNDSEIKEKTSP